MTRRLAFTLALALVVVTGSLLAVGWRGFLGTKGPIPPQTMPSTFYGVDAARMDLSVQNIWPQHSGPYCGVATALAAVNFDDHTQGFNMRFTSRSAQITVARANQSAGKSHWGYAKPTNVVAGITNIAPDFGTDPRSIAYMTKHYAPANTYFHDHIYRWQFANSTQPSFTTQVSEATTNVAQALETWHEPVNVTINGGLHSVLVTGITSLTDPATTYPAQIVSIVYRDPMAAPSISSFEVDFATWAGGHFSTPAGVYSLWSLYYGDVSRPGDGRNGNDPEPTVGAYKPTTSHPVHWYRGFTWIQRDSHANTSADYAYTSKDVVMTSP
jgi:hypothetical protein